MWQGRSSIAVLLDRDKDLGEVRPGQFIITSAQTGPQGTTLDVLVVNGDDARAQSLKKASNHIGH